MVEYNTSIDADDGYWVTNGVGFNDDELSLPFGIWRPVFSYDYYNTFILFNNVTIVQGSTITEAYLQFYPDLTNSNNPQDIEIRAENVDSGVAPTDWDEAEALSLTSKVDWSPGDWTYTVPVDSPSIVSIIQGIVNRAGWASGNDILIVLNGITEGSDNLRKVISHDSGGAITGPKLFINASSPEVILAGVRADGVKLSDSQSSEIKYGGRSADGVKLSDSQSSEITYGATGSEGIKFSDLIEGNVIVKRRLPKAPPALPPTVESAAILLEWNAGGHLYRFSNTKANLTHPWYPYIKAFMLNWKMEKDYGGYIRPSVSQITFAPTAFAGRYPVAITAAFALYYAYTTEEEKIFLTAGAAHLGKWSSQGVPYQLYRPPYSLNVNEGKDYTGYTLFSVFKEVSFFLGLTLSATRANKDLAVNYIVESETNAIDFLSDLAASNAHCFWIDEERKILYLIDLADRPAARVQTVISGKVKPLTYGAFNPVALYKCDSQAGSSAAEDVVLEGTYPYGSELSVDMYDDDDSRNYIRLERIKTVLDQRKIYWKAKIGESFPLLGSRYTYLDRDMFGAGNFISSDFMIRNMQVDFVSESMVLSGEGNQS